MGPTPLLLMTLAAFLVLGDAVEDSDSTAPQAHQKAWRETEDEVAFGTRDGDSEPSESQDTKSSYKDHPNNGPLLEQERPRPRNRSRSNGKRRRRMRKRPRTTTPETYVEETWEAQQQPEIPNGEELLLKKPRFQSERIQDDIRDLPIEEPEEIKPQQRRRPGRRRRPHHRRPAKTEDKYEEHNISEKQHEELARDDKPENRTRSETVSSQGRKRRRGNGRKRIKVETEPPITVVETSSQTIVETTPEDITRYEEPHSKGLIETKEQETTEHTEYLTSPEKTQNTDPQLSTTVDLEEPSKATSESSTILQETDETQQPQTVDSHHTEIHYSTTFSTRHTSDLNTYAAKNLTIESSSMPSLTTEPIQETTMQPTRSLPSRFSSKHKLHSRISSDSSRTSTTEPPVEHTTTEKIKKFKAQHNESEVKIDRKTLFSSSSRRLPPTSAIIRRRLKQKTNNTVTNDDEETNATHLNTAKKYLRGKSERTNQIEPSTLLPPGFKTNPEILSPMKLLEEVTLNEVLKMMTSTTEPSSDEIQTTIRMESNEADTSRLNLDGVELPNIRDEILDLIKSESGSSRLARILELRNMTLTDLLEHRERGSSQLYFSESFNKRPTEMPSTMQPATKKTSTTTSTTEPPTTIIIPKTVKPFSQRTAKTTPATKPTTNFIVTTEIYETEAKTEELETLYETETRGKPTMKIEASIMSMPILEPTHISRIQFPEQGIQTKFPKLLMETLKHEETKIPQRPKTEDKMIGAASKTRLYAFITETDDDENDKRKPRLFDSMPAFLPNKTTAFKTVSNKLNKTGFLNWKSQTQTDHTKPFKGEHKELVIAVTTGRSKQIDVDDVLLFNENDEQPRNNAAGKIMADIEATKTKEEDYSSEVRRFPPGVKNAILASGAILGLAILGFLTVLVSCRLRQKNSRIRGKRDILCEQLQEDFRSSQCSLSPVLNKTHRTPVFGQGIHSNTTSNRHYYLWRTLRKTFQYE